MAFTQDTFEDAVDARSVRSLTKRSSSVQKPAPSPPLDDDEPEAVPDVPTSDAVPQPETEKVHTNGNADVHNDDDEDAPAPPEKDAVEATIEDDLPRDPKRVSSVISTGTLDEVKLDDVKLDDVKLDDSKIDDETASQPKGMSRFFALHTFCLLSMPLTLLLFQKMNHLPSRLRGLPKSCRSVTLQAPFPQCPGLLLQATHPRKTAPALRLYQQALPLQLEILLLPRKPRRPFHEN